MLHGFSLCKCLRSGMEWELNVSPQARLVSQLWVVTMEEDTWVRPWMIWFVTRPWDSSRLRGWIWSLPYKHLVLRALVGSFGTCSPEVDDWERDLECQICLLGEPGFSVCWCLRPLEKWRLKRKEPSWMPCLSHHNEPHPLKLWARRNPPSFK